MILARKANELLAAYIQAERQGEDILADSIEDELNEAGWLITSQNGVLEVVRKNAAQTAQNITDGITDLFLPKENKLDSYRPPEKKSVFTTKNIMIGIGVLAGGGLLVWLIVWAVKRKKG